MVPLGRAICVGLLHNTFNTVHNVCLINIINCNSIQLPQQKTVPRRKSKATADGLIHRSTPRPTYLHGYKIATTANPVNIRLEQNAPLRIPKPILRSLSISNHTASRQFRWTRHCVLTHIAADIPRAAYNVRSLCTPGLKVRRKRQPLWTLCFHGPRTAASAAPDYNLFVTVLRLNADNA